MLVPGQTQGRLSLRIIDYDGLWTPDLAGTPSGEAGHAAYQHPDRQRQQIYSPEIDRFPHLVIALAMRCISRPNQVDLWRRYQSGDNLMFTRNDFEKPESSALLHELWMSRIPKLQSWAGLIAVAAKSPLKATPRLKERLVDGKLLTLPAEELAQAREILEPQPATASSGTATKTLSDTGEHWWEKPLEDIDADEVVALDDDVATQEVRASSATSDKKVNCPVCNKILKLSDKMRGRGVICPGCQTGLRVSDDLRQLVVSRSAGDTAEAVTGTKVVRDPTPASPRVIVPSETPRLQTKQNGTSTANSPPGRQVHRCQPSPVQDHPQNPSTHRVRRRSRQESRGRKSLSSLRRRAETRGRGGRWVWQL